MDHNLYHGQVENRYNQPITTKQVLRSGVAQWVAHLTRDRWTPVGGEPYQRLLLFP